MKYVTFVLPMLVIAGCSKQPATVSIDTPRGTISYKESAYPDKGAFENGIRDLSKSEADRLRKFANDAPDFVNRYVPAAQQHPDLLENLDTAFAAWLNSTNPTKELPQDVEGIIGAALGQYCIEHLKLRWAVYTESEGSDFALVGDNPPTRSFPITSVRYRIEDRKTDFVGALYETIAHLRK